MQRRVYQATGPTDAYLVRDWLERNGIRVFVRGEGLMSLRGELPISWPSLWVEPADEGVANEALAAFHAPTLVHPDWKCDGCGEQNAPTFGSCWSCGRDAA
jgi:hypothetical protein